MCHIDVSVSKINGKYIPIWRLTTKNIPCYCGDRLSSNERHLEILVEKHSWRRPRAGVKLHMPILFSSPWQRDLRPSLGLDSRSRTKCRSGQVTLWAYWEKWYANVQSCTCTAVPIPPEARCPWNSEALISETGISENSQSPVLERQLEQFQADCLHLCSPSMWLYCKGEPPTKVRLFRRPRSCKSKGTCSPVLLKGVPTAWHLVENIQG